MSLASLYADVVAETLDHTASSVLPADTANLGLLQCVYCLYCCLLVRASLFMLHVSYTNAENRK